MIQNQRKRVSPFLLLFSFLSVFSTYGQDTIRYTLDQVIHAGLDSSHQTKLADLKAELVAAKVRQIKDGSLPKLGVLAGYNHISVLSPFMISPSAGLPKSEMDAFIGVASASYDVFGVLTEKNKENAAEYLAKASEMDVQKDRAEVEYNLKAAYYTIYKIMRSEAILDENIKVIEEREREAQSLVKGGVLLQNELLKLQLQKSNLTLAKVDIKNNLNVSLYNLGLLIGVPEGQVLSIDTTNLPLHNLIAGNDHELVKQALLQRTEIQAADYRINAAYSARKALNVAYIPKVEASVMYAFVNPALKDHFIPTQGGYLNAVVLGVTAKYSIASFWNMKGRKQEAQLNIDQASEASETQRDQIRSEVYGQLANYRSAMEKITVSEKALEQAEESLKLSTSQFQNGLLLSADLLQSQNLKLQAELSLLQTRIDVQIVYYRLQKALGNH